MSWRYELGKDFLLAPYDWRLAGDAHGKRANGVGGYYEQLKLLIENAVQAGPRAPRWQPMTTEARVSGVYVCVYYYIYMI